MSLRLLAAVSMLALCASVHAARPLEDVDYHGWVDEVDTTHVVGWAADKNRLNQAVAVCFFGCSEPFQPLSKCKQLGKTLATLSRPDVGSYLGDEGMHGFDYRWKSPIGEACYVRVGYASPDSGQEIYGIDGRGWLVCQK